MPDSQDEHFDKHHALTSSYRMHLRIKRDELWIRAHIEQTVTGQEVTAHDLNASDSGCMFHPGHTSDLFLLVASWRFLYIIIICKYATNWSASLQSRFLKGMLVFYVNKSNSNDNHFFQVYRDLAERKLCNY